MSKKLKIQFWKAEKALAMQILEQEGLPEEKADGFVNINDIPWLSDERIDLRGYYHNSGLKIVTGAFDTNAKRDAFLQKVVNAITDELFTVKGEFKVGEMCEVWDPDSKKWQKRKLLAILPENYEKGFIVADLCEPNSYVSFPAARTIAKRAEPRVEENGDVVTYTWEE